MNGFELVSHRRVIDSTSAGQWDVTYDGPIDECEEYKLRAENAKLRELVRDVWQFTGAACKKYPRLFDQPAQGAQAVLPNAIDAFEQRMRELGIEVDE